MRPLRPIGVLAALLPLVALAYVKPPDACKLLTLEDVTAVLGAGYAPGPLMEFANTSELSSCLYQKGTNSVAVTVLNAPDKNGKAAVQGRYDRQKKAGRQVETIPGVCEAAYTQPGVPPNTVLVAAKGPWQIDIQVLVGRKPDVGAEQKFAKAICSRIT